MRGFPFRLALALTLLVLTACAGQHVRPVAPSTDPALLARQSAREETLAARTDWSLRGRLGVSDARDSGSGSLDWEQHGDRYRFTVHAPVTGKTWALSGDASHARLDGLRAEPVEAEDAQYLLARELGWNVPMAHLASWVLGMRGSPEARIAFRDDGLPLRIDEDGWRVDYLDYDLGLVPPLPTKVFASKGDWKVRLAVRAWQLP